MTKKILNHLKITFTNILQIQFHIKSHTSICSKINKNDL